MTTQQWMAALVALVFVSTVNFSLKFKSIDQSLGIIAARMNTSWNVRVQNIGFDTTNHLAPKWELEHQ